MARKAHVSETPATALLRSHGVGFSEHEPCRPEVANRHSGYLFGGTSPFGTRKCMPVYIERSILELQRIWINGGRRGYLVSLAPEFCTRLLGAKPVDCALEL